MAKIAVTNNRDQAIGIQYKESSGPRFRWLRMREKIVMEDTRMHQSITDLNSKGHVTLDNNPLDPYTPGFEPF